MVQETKNEASDILTRLTKEAKAGSVDSLDKIYHVLTPETCTIDVLEVALQYLRIELVPSLELGEFKDPNFKEKSKAALNGLLILGNITLVCNSNVKLKTALVEQVVASIDGVLGWTALFLRVGWFGRHTPVKPDFREAYLFHSEFLSDLADASPLLRRALLTTPAFGDLLLRLWMMKGEKGEYFMSLTNRKGCPILSLFARTVEHEEGREVLFQRLFSCRRHFCSNFVDAVVTRARTIGETPFGADPNETSKQVMNYIQKLLATSHHLLAHDALRRKFVAVRYLTTFAWTLNRLALAFERHGFLILLDGLIKPITTVAKLVFPSKHRVVLNYRDLVSGGFITLLVRVMANLKQEEYNKILFYTAFGFLGPPGLYTIYPCVLRGLARAPLPESKVNKLVRNPVISEQWSGYQSFLSRRTAILNATPRSSTMCDNHSCDPDRRVPPSKQCSGCYTVVYCSEKCQKEDWIKLHRAECSSARDDNSTRRALHARYHQTARAFHMEYVTAEYNSNMVDIQRQRSVEYPNLPAHRVLPVMYFTVPESSLAMDFEPITLKGPNGIGWNAGKDMKKSFENQKHFSVRHHRMLEAFATGKEDPAVQMVLGVFPLGHDHSVFLTVRMEKTKGSPWFTATHSLYRYGLLSR